MVAAQKLHQAGAIRVGILDLDAHYGNGTDDIIRCLGLEYVTHYTFGGRDCADGGEDWLKRLPAILERFRGCCVLLYQAGADPHVHDPLGGILTTAQMYERDACVFTTMKKIGVPVAWNLAGGYQKPLSRVLDLHDNTFRACLNAYAKRSGRKILLTKGRRHAEAE
jgi:acetoin utilization deacetylase AcuC-like enzyme